jgi:hypothetical protein
MRPEGGRQRHLGARGRGVEKQGRSLRGGEKGRKPRDRVERVAERVEALYRRLLHQQDATGARRRVRAPAQRFLEE